jgi:addiction module RelE/StbE family toxin
MQVRYTKRFVKQLAKQPVKVQDAFKLRISIFRIDMHDPMLRNHALQGKLKGFYSINIAGDIRAIYHIVDDEVFLYDLIGSHSQLYG